MEKEIAISVIVPVYNIEAYLNKCMESLRNQTFDSYEVILVNDGSTDKSGEIAEEYAKLHSETFRFVSQENMGLSEARNTGLRYAKGKYVCFVDSDDYVETAYLEELYRCAQKDDADLVFCAFQSVDEQGKVLKEVYESGFESGRVYTIEERKDLLLTQNAAWNKLYKKEIIDKHSLTFTAGAWYEDLRFVKKYMLYATKFVYCDRILLNYLIRQGSIMNSMGSKRNVEIIDAFDEVIAFYKQKNVYEQYVDEIEFLAIEHMYIATLVRLIRAKDKEQWKKIREAFVERFPNYKKNQYLCRLERGRKFIYVLLNVKFNFIIRMLFALKEKN
jgi:glycosyltransferase involved in cell wall biosynthesis